MSEKPMKSFAPPDWIPAPNIHENKELYGLENKALLRDGRLEDGLRQVADFTGKDLLDLGCGEGFWLPVYASRARFVLGVEPDPTLLPKMNARIASLPNARATQGSAEHIPLPPESVDMVHARFAYFFGEGADRGLAEVMRVLKPGGVFIAIDNSWEGGQFANLLDWATEGNGAIDPDRARRWWEDKGAKRIEIAGGWECEDRDQLAAILAMEFGQEITARAFDELGLSNTISYHFALYVMERSAP